MIAAFRKRQLYFKLHNRRYDSQFQISFLPIQKPNSTRPTTPPPKPTSLWRKVRRRRRPYCHHNTSRYILGAIKFGQRASRIAFHQLILLEHSTSFRYEVMSIASNLDQLFLRQAFRGKALWVYSREDHGTCFIS